MGSSSVTRRESKSRDDVPPLVRDILRVVERSTWAKPTPYPIGHAYLNLKAHPDLIDRAIEAAHSSGWLRVIGTPPHSVTLTAAGKRVLGRGA
jgi:hypothetical protein